MKASSSPHSALVSTIAILFVSLPFFSILSGQTYAAPLYLSIDASVDPAEMYPNETFTVYGTVKLGDQLVGGAEVNISVEKVDPPINATVTTDDHGTFSADLKADLTPGNYSVNITARYVYNAQTYTNYTTLFIDVVNPPPPAPDFAVFSGDITFWPKYISAGDKVFVNATIHNLGTENGSGEVRVFEGTPSNGTILLVETLNISAGGAENTTATWVAKSGVTTFTVVINNVAPSDTNLTNNQASKNLSVRDTVPPNISTPVVEPETPVVGDTVSINVSVTDDLALATDEPVRLRYRWESGSGDGAFVGGVEAMNQTKHGYVATIGPFSYGTLYYNITATDSSGNTATTPTYKIPIGHSDLVLSYKMPADVYEGNNITLVVQTSFEDGTAAQNVSLTMAVDGSVLDKQAITDSSGYAAISIPPQQPGEHTVNITATYTDPRTGQMIENTTTVDIHVNPLYPDIVIKKEWVAVETLSYNMVNLSVVIYNRGDKTGAGTLKIWAGEWEGKASAEENFEASPGEFLVLNVSVDLGDGTSSGSGENPPTSDSMASVTLYIFCEVENDSDNTTNLVLFPVLLPALAGGGSAIEEGENDTGQATGEEGAGSAPDNQTGTSTERAAASYVGPILLITVAFLVGVFGGTMITLYRRRHR